MRTGFNGRHTNVYEKVVHLDVGNIGRPNVNPPDVVIQDNVQLLAFTVDTDRVFLVWDVPVDYAGGDLKIHVEWTNDGGVDDNGLDVKCQITYQTFGEGTSIAGNHANSPKDIEDTYTSASGWIFHETGAMTIAAADFAGITHGIGMEFMFVTPAGAALSGLPHLIGIEIEYWAQGGLIRPR